MGTLRYYAAGAIGFILVALNVMDLWYDGTLPLLLLVAMVYYGTKKGRALLAWCQSRLRA